MTHFPVKAYTFALADPERPRLEAIDGIEEIPLDKGGPDRMV